MRPSTMTDLGLRLELAANHARVASGASLVVCVHADGLAGIAADSRVDKVTAAEVLRHLADHIDGTAHGDCAGYAIRPLRIVEPPT